MSALAGHKTEGRVIYAVGDLHGRIDLLDRMIRAIADDLDDLNPLGEPLLVFLGDYVDRGPDSRAVLDRLLALKTVEGCEVRTVMGNHEAALLTFLTDPASGAAWSKHGGLATLASYGVPLPRRRTEAASWVEASHALRAALPADHLKFLAGLSMFSVTGDYVFVHAGLRPYVCLAEQEDRDLLWIRARFIDHGGPFPKIVVHGHTPSKTVVITPNRIGVDTGAYATGRLSAARLMGDEVKVVEVRA